MGGAGGYIAVEGVIGVGKTTLTNLIARAWGATSVLEAVEENPFLRNFYGDRQRFAFQTETFFLLSRYRQHVGVIKAAVEHEFVVTDYLFAKNKLFARLNLDGDELTLFEQLYGVLVERMARPAVVVFLQARVDTLMERIARRDRPYERNIGRAYIAALAARYEEFFASYDESVVLAVGTDERDLVADRDAQLEVLDMIRAAVEGYRQRPIG
ncbi:MAG: deoxynucleoside kinase [Herpetosiphon sp.]